MIGAVRFRFRQICGMKGESILTTVLYAPEILFLRDLVYEYSSSTLELYAIGSWSSSPRLDLVAAWTSWTTILGNKPMMEAVPIPADEGFFSPLCDFDLLVTSRLWSSIWIARSTVVPHNIGTYCRNMVRTPFRGQDGGGAVLEDCKVSRFGILSWLLLDQNLYTCDDG